MSACRCDLQCTADVFLPLYIREIRKSRLTQLRHRRSSRRNLFFASQVFQQLLQIVNRNHGNILCESRFRCVFFRHEECSDSCPLCSHCHRQCTRDRAQLACQGELSEKSAVLRDLFQILRGREDADQQRQVINRTGLFLVGRCKIHRHAADRKLKAVVFDRGPYTLSGFFDSGVRESDDIEGRQSGRDIHFHADFITADSADAETPDPGKHL